MGDLVLKRDDVIKGLLPGRTVANPRSREILRRSVGIGVDGSKTMPMTVHQIAQLLNFPEDRVADIAEGALDNLGHVLGLRAPIARELLEFLLQ